MAANSCNLSPASHGTLVGFLTRPLCSSSKRCLSFRSYYRLRNQPPCPKSGWGMLATAPLQQTTGHTGPYPAVRWIEHRRCFAPMPKSSDRGVRWSSSSVPSSNAVRLSPFPAASKARCLEFDRMVDTRSPHPSILPAFRPSTKLVPPTMPSADFCIAVRSPGDTLSPDSGTRHRSPEVSPTTFARARRIYSPGP